MIPFILIAAMAADPAPFSDHTSDQPTPVEGQNDLKHPAQGPQSVHVGICNGSDIEGKEIMLLDRLCLNRAAVVQTIAGLDTMQRDRDDLLNKLNATNKALFDSQQKEGLSPIGVAIVSTGVTAVVLGAVLGGLAAAGKLK